MIGKDNKELIDIFTHADEKAKQLSIKLTECDLSVRALNCLSYTDIRTIGDLARCRQSDLMRFRNFGKRTLIELEKFLENLGLHFGMDVETIYRERIAALETLKL